MLSLSIIGNASTASSNCDSVLKACDEALTACEKTVDAKNKQIKLCDLALKRATDSAAFNRVQYEKAQEKLDAWYRNPYVMFGLGLAAGVIAIEVAK